MNKHYFFLILYVFFAGCTTDKGDDVRMVQNLETGWLFYNDEVPDGEKPEISTVGWESVRVPHDWAISGEFDEMIDAQEVLVNENGEWVSKLERGKTGGLPHIGTGWYRRTIEIPAAWQEKRIHLEFDGAMSHAKVYMNGIFVGEWPYGYASFGFDVTDFMKPGEDNLLAMRLENKPGSSRWYPGAGIYRNVRMVVTNPVYVRHWGTYLTTPGIQDGKGTVHIETRIMNKTGVPRKLILETSIISPKGDVVETLSSALDIQTETTVLQDLEVPSPELWSDITPVLYTAISRVLEDDTESSGGRELDLYKTTFGFRYFEFTNTDGFLLNGKRVPLNGVCLHHDLGPLGAAVNKSSLRHRMNLLKEMGCNSIRTSHNPPAPELLELADEMGFLILDEAFDEWKHGKTENGYNTLWDEWAEKDLTAMIHRDRNHPSVIMWSIGNEIQEQSLGDGAEYARFLVEICKREDPTRPTTAGFDRWEDAIRNGLAEAVDVQGWNYKPQYYGYIHKEHPEWKMYASETASTVSSRGEYFWPAEVKVHYTRQSLHSSSFDMEYPSWATSPDREFASQDSFRFMAGEYVWTGFDYLGEPTPYKIQWPARSSYFGILDLCGIPKDRYYLYQSRWTDKDVLHLLPHWNWEEGQSITVHCYTHYNKAELFLNGKSLGVRRKDPSNLYTSYRIVWNDITYEAGELKVVALDESNMPLKEETIRTAGEPAKIILEADRTELSADGNDLSFVTVTIVDADGIVCPRASNLVNFTVQGSGFLRAVGNGDPTSLESFVKPCRRAFNGKCMAILQSTKSSGKIILKAESEGLQTETISIESRL